MNAFERKQKLNWLRDATNELEQSKYPTARLLSNARCLVEGVDVPALDAVLFFDPKQSHVDIVQAVGRVMRKASGKTIGYVILPIIIEAGERIDSPEVMANNDDFKQVFTILNALRSHDERLDIFMNSKNTAQKAPLKIMNRGGIDLSSKTVDDARRQALALQQNIWSVIVDHCGDKRAWSNWGRRTATAYKRIRHYLQEKFDDEGDLRVHDCIQAFTQSMQKTITPDFNNQDALDMIAQHVITMPVLQAFCADADFAEFNPVSVDLRNVVEHLQDIGIHVEDYINQLTDIYKRLPLGISEDNPAEKLDKLKDMYGGFFKTAVPEVVDRQGIVYTPIQIVDFMLRSVDALLKAEFKHGIGDKNVTILDPFVGTGTFPARLLNIKNTAGEYLISDANVAYKYQHEIKAYEFTMLAYYIAALTIEVSASERGIWRNQYDYQPFKGISLADTFLSWTDSMQKSRHHYIQLALFDADAILENSQRVHNQADVPIKVIIGNPPWSAGQKSAGDDNPRAQNSEIAERVRQTFGRKRAEITDSTVAGGNAAGNLYVQSFRWAMDRLARKQNDALPGDGIIAFLHPNSLVNGTSFIGMRACLRDEFTSVYVVNLRGDALKMGDAWKREGDKIFASGSRSGCQITFLVRNTSERKPAKVYYTEVADYSKLQDKFDWLAQLDITNHELLQEVPLHPKHHWINVGDGSYDKLLTVYDTNQENAEVVFQKSVLGITTACDSYVYSFSRDTLIERVQRLIQAYETARKQFHIDGRSIEDCTANNQLENIRWNRELRRRLRQNVEIQFDIRRVREVCYRPFVKLWLYEDHSILSAGQAVSDLFNTPPHPSQAILIATTGSTTFGLLATAVIGDINNITPTRLIARK